MVDLGSKMYGEANAQVIYSAREDIIPTLELLTPDFGDTIEDFARNLEPSNINDPLSGTQDSERERTSRVEIKITDAIQTLDFNNNVVVRVRVFYEFLSTLRFNFSLDQRDMWGGKRVFVRILDITSEVGIEYMTEVKPRRIYVEYEFTIVEA